MVYEYIVTNNDKNNNIIGKDIAGTDELELGQSKASQSLIRNENINNFDNYTIEEMSVYEVRNIISCIYLNGVVTILHRLDLYSRTHSKILNVYAELKDISGVTNFMNSVKSDGTKISNIEVKKSNEIDIHIIGLTMTLTLAKKIDHAEYILKLHTIENVCSVEEII